jgi:hypothetical protein
VWLASGADPKVVQRVLGHATAAMTMDLYGHMIDRNLWDAAQRLGGHHGHGRTRDRTMKMAPWGGESPLTRDNALEPPRGIEPRTYALRERRQT